MKKETIFKSLIDFIFIMLCLGFLSLLFVAPLGLNMFAIENKEIYNWGLFSWTIHLVSVLSYIILIIGISYLRKTARLMISTRLFDQNISLYLKKAGKFLISSSILSYTVFILIFIEQIYTENKLEIVFDSNLLLEMIITAVGLFFIIQSEALIRARLIKEENDLTI